MSKTTLWWSQQKQQDEEENENDVVLEETNTATHEEEKEAMFEKPLTPSDVGKLNRLVIPKQHAERYFPLDSEEIKGLLLSFEDESGKCWRFRYSYWNSSQSYVLTKGWSRYVKDKRLDAGDVVLFHRHRSCPKRFFISWRRRNNSFSTTPPAHVSGRPLCDANGNISLGWSRGFYPAHPYPTHHQTVSYHAGGGSQSQSPSTACGNSSSSSTYRVLRLFGVNVECQLDNNINDSETLTPECAYNMSLAQGTATPQFYHHRQPSYNSSSNHHMLRQQPY